MFGTEEPRRDGDQAEERDGHEKLALHGRAFRMANDTKGDGAFMRSIFRCNR
jgi:hypothetical protein